MDEPIPYQPTDKAMLVGLRARVDELESLLRRFDRTTLNLAVYSSSIDGLPDDYEWRTVLELVEEVRGVYGPPITHR